MDSSNNNDANTSITTATTATTANNDENIDKNQKNQTDNPNNNNNNNNITNNNDTTTNNNDTNNDKDGPDLKLVIENSGISSGNVSDSGSNVLLMGDHAAHSRSSSHSSIQSDDSDGFSKANIEKLLREDGNFNIANASTQNMIELLQRELYEQSQKLKAAYQASLELVETNEALHEELETSEANMEMLQNTVADYELTV